MKLRPRYSLRLLLAVITALSVIFFVIGSNLAYDRERRKNEISALESRLAILEFQRKRFVGLTGCAYDDRLDDINSEIASKETRLTELRSD